MPAIPDHELLRLIGRGSYGEVWLARTAFGTLRAVKVVRRTFFDSDRPYARELAGIQRYEPVSRSHDGLVDVLHVGRNEPEGFFYYVMELADPAASASTEATAPASSESSNSTLILLPASPANYVPRTLASDLTRRGRLPVAEAIPVFLNLVNALGHLHRQGLLHRDVKPANVIFVQGVAKLADIGLVAEAGESRTFVGTEGFIPPEGPGTVSADLYALGKLMYEAVTGRDRNDFPALPLDRSNPADNAALLELNAVLLKCCDPDPAKRYHSAAAVQADLALLQSGQSVTRLHSFERRLRLARQAGLVAVALAFLAMITAFIIKRQEQLAQDNFRRSETLRFRAENAENEANERLHAALLARAAAERRTGAAGARRQALESLRQAAALRPVTPEMRREAISTLALADFPVVRRWTSSVPSLQPLSLSYDASRLAVAQPGGVVEIRRASDDKVLFSLKGNTPDGQWVGPFSPDGRWLVVTATDGHVRLWDTTDGSVRADWKASANMERLLYFGTNQVLLKFAGRADILNLDNDTLRSWVVRGAVGVWPCSDGRRAAINRADNVVELWDAQKNIKLRDWRLATNNGAYCCAWNATGTLLAVGTSDRRVLVFSPEVEGDEPLQVFRGHGAEVESVAWSSDDRFVVSCAWDTTTRIWGLMEGRELTRELVQSWHFGFTPDGRQFSCFVPSRNELTLSDVHYQDICRTLPEPNPGTVKTPRRAVFTPDSQWMFTATFDGVRTYRVSDGQPGPILTEPGGAAEIFIYPAPSHHFVAMTVRGRLLGEWRTNSSGMLELSEVEPVEREELARIHPQRIPWLGRPDRNLRWFDADGTQEDLADSTDPADSELSPDGRFAGAVLYNYRAYYWPVERGAKRHDLGPSRGRGLAFTHDGRGVFHVTQHELCRTSTETGALEWRTHLTDIEYGAGAIRVSPDGRLVATVMTPFTVSLLDAVTGVLVATIEHPDAQLINNIGFSPDGRYFAVTCSTHQTQLWNLQRLRAELAALKLDW